MRKTGTCLEKYTIQGTCDSAWKRGKLKKSWMDDTQQWTRLTLDKTTRATKDFGEKLSMGDAVHSWTEDG